MKINEKEAPLCDARYHRENSTLRPCRDVDGPRAETSNHHESATFFFGKHISRWIWCRACSLSMRACETTVKSTAMNPRRSRQPAHPHKWRLCAKHTNPESQRRIGLPGYLRKKLSHGCLQFQVQLERQLPVSRRSQLGPLEPPWPSADALSPSRHWHSVGLSHGRLAVGRPPGRLSCSGGAAAVEVRSSC